MNIKLSTGKMNDEIHRANDKSLNCFRARLSLTSIPTPNTVARAYLRDLRAAEMTAWEMTGGDYLLSPCGAGGNFIDTGDLSAKQLS